MTAPAIHAPQDAEFITAQLAAIPRMVRQALADRYARTFKRTPERTARRAANTELRDTVERFKAASPVLAADDESIRSLAKRAADHVARRVAAYRRDRWGAWSRAAEVCRRNGLEPCGVGTEPGQARTVDGAINRMKCPRWWRRQLRVTHGRAVEGVCIETGMVGPGIQRRRYCSDYAARRWQTEQGHLRRMIEEARAVCEDTGEAVKLEAIICASMANPQLRRMEMMTRIRGFTEAADARGHVAEFFTITCPSRFHSVGGDNDRYAGATPRDAQAYLCATWAKVRAAWGRAGIRPYGFRICEPHTDGCPHWHLLLFMPADQADEAAAIARRYALAEDGDEPGAAEHRFRRESIDRERGTPAGYVAKYIAKAIDGHCVGEVRDMLGAVTGDDAQDAAQRIRAWASTWGIRQFQQIGGPPVGTWRELRRLDRVPGGISDNLEAARAAADAGDWCAFVEAMGGPICPRDALPVRVHRRKRITDPVNTYGEPAEPRTLGIECGRVIIPTRLESWRVEWHADWPLQGQRSAAEGERDAAPWTCGNNCTEQPRDPNALHRSRDDHPPPGHRAAQPQPDGAGSRSPATGRRGRPGAHRAGPGNRPAASGH